MRRERALLVFFLFLLPVTAAQAAYTPDCSTLQDVMDLPPGHWCEVPNTRLQDVEPVPNAAGSLSSVIGAWSGGAYDTKRDYFIVWGGGHFDYGGNEVYAFDIQNLEWLRLTDPYCPEPIENNECASHNEADYGDPDSGEYPDGTAGARHTHNMIQYVASIDSFCTFGGKIYGDVDGTQAVHCLDFDDITPTAPRGWVRKQDMPHTAAKNRSAYDPITGHLWTHGGGDLMQWDPIANEWSIRSGERGKHTMIADIDPVRRKFVTTGRRYSDAGTGLVYTFDIDEPGTLTRHTLATSGAKSAVEDYAFPGFVYDSAIGNFVGWVGGTSVYKLDVDSGVWTECTADGANAKAPHPPQDNGINGRWRYVPPPLDVFVTVQGVGKNVFFYKLSSACAGDPPVCGNGVIEGGEACDDGNASGGDGCSSSCSVESGWFCDTQSPTTCIEENTPPSAPGNLSAVAQGMDRIDLAWTASSDPQSGISSYRIYRDEALLGSSGETSFSDTGLAEATTYSYQVSAVNGVGMESALAGPVSATTESDTTPPAIVSVVATGATSVAVVFDEAVEEASATAASNYSVAPAISVESAVLAPDLVTVVLTVSPMVTGTEYTLTVDGVRDRASVPNTIAPGTTASFTYTSIVAVEFRISNGADDVEEAPDGDVTASSTDLELVEEGGTPQTVGLRFRSVQIPQGAVIVNATLQFVTDETTSNACELLIEGEANDDAEAFGSVVSRPRTSASVAWSPQPWETVGEAGPAQRTGNLAAVIQQIVGRPGWSAGNALVLIISGSGSRVAESYDGDSSLAPLLQVEYSFEAATDPPEPPEGLEVQ